MPVVVTASSDFEYFKLYAEPFARSAIMAGHPCHINLISSRPEDHNHIQSYLNEVFYPKFDDEEKKQLTVAVRGNSYVPSPVDMRAFYASFRFLIAPEMLATINSPILILDIDCIVNKPIVIPDDVDIGLFLREDNDIGANDYERMGMKVAAGALYIAPTEKGMFFAKAVRQHILTNTFQWFCDQIAIYLVFDHMRKDGTLKYTTFDNSFMDWEFNEGTTCWTGKGDRKHSNKKYIDRVNSYRKKD